MAVVFDLGLKPRTVNVNRDIILALENEVKYSHTVNPLYNEVFAPPPPKKKKKQKKTKNNFDV